MGVTSSMDFVNIQDDVRQAFGWSYVEDVKSARGLRDACNQYELGQECGWSSDQRHGHLHSLKDRLNSAACIVLVGAAAISDELCREWPRDTEFIACDGAVGACLPHVNPLCVVTDLDGGPHLDLAAAQHVTMVVHAHGDNTELWKECLQRWQVHQCPLILTHQTHEDFEDMLNPGGFTDGDRALCLLVALEIPLEKVVLVGYKEDAVGPWSGQTDPIRKLEKLTWMAKILDAILPAWRSSAPPE